LYSTASNSSFNLSIISFPLGEISGETSGELSVESELNGELPTE
jgi:hypothetical protein